jgi:peptide/nickel transport system permease protein
MPVSLSQLSTRARRHPQLAAGLALVLLVVAFGPVGSLFVDTDLARVGSAAADQSPTVEHLLGTDAAGRDLLAVMVAGTPLTLRVGFIAGVVGLGIGIVLGFLAGYFGGLLDTLIQGAADVMLTIPGLLFLVVLATSLHTEVTVNMMALVVASLAWMFPTRTIRAQVLSMRERAYVEVARLSGMGDLEIIVRELLPNLLPYLAASFVSAVGSAVLASIGLEALGLGPQNEPTLGMTIYWALYYTSLLRGVWWWWAPPITMIVVIFVGLYLVSMGLDRIANPRLWKSA